MEIDAKVISLMQENSISFLHLLTMTFMRPLGLLFGFIGISWAIGGASSLIRTAIAFALAIPVMFHESTNLITFLSGANYLNMTVLVIKEFGLGFAFGIIVSVPFWIVQFGGALLDSYRGESNSGGQDPTGGEISSLARFHLITALLVFASLAGFTLMVGAFYKTYLLWPITAPFPEIQSITSTRVLELMNYIVLQGLIIAAPLLFIMIAIDFLALVCGKIAKGFSAMDFSFALKNLLTVILLPILAIIFVHAIQDTYFKKSTVTDILQEVLK